MIQLKLQTKSKPQEMIKTYLEQNASESLADKINNGTSIVKDGKELVNRKTLDGFVAYACEEARKLAEKGARTACVEDNTVYGWAVHYFEEDSIEGTLFNEDGTEYKPPKPKYVPKKVSVAETKPQLKPPSLFDLMNEHAQEVPPVDTEQATPDMSSVVAEPSVTEDDDEAPDEEIPKDLAQTVEERQQSNNEQNIEVPQGSPLYRQYINVQKQYPDSIVALRIGDFYEIFGQNSVTLAEELNLTLTSRECGLSERVPMIGFPYHAADTYFRKIIDRGHKISIRETLGEINQAGHPLSEIIDGETGEVLSDTMVNRADADNAESKLKKNIEIPKEPDTTILSKLSEILGDVFILR